MAEQDNGNSTTKKIYQLATEPIFASDHNLDRPDVSWEVSDGIPAPLPPLEIVDESLESEENKETDDESLTSEIEESSEEEKEKIKKRNRTSEKKRISDLTRQLKQAQSVAHDVLTRNQFLETKLTEKQREALETEENLLTSQKERVKNYLTDAIEEGDPQKIAEAHDLLSQYNAEIQLKKSQKTTFQNSGQKPYSPQEPIFNDVPEDYTHEHGQEWIESNGWANPNSDEFDQSLYNEADNYSLKLAAKYRLQGKKSEVGSPEFWNEITNFMHSTYGISDDNNNVSPPIPNLNKGRTPMKTGTPNQVASVTRQSPPSQAPLKSKDIVLTPEQREAAHSMRGYVRDPKTGQKINDNRALEEIYKRNMRG